MAILARDLQKMLRLENELTSTRRALILAMQVIAGTAPEGSKDELNRMFAEIMK